MKFATIHREVAVESLQSSSVSQIGGRSIPSTNDELHFISLRTDSDSFPEHYLRHPGLVRRISPVLGSRPSLQLASPGYRAAPYTVTLGLSRPRRPDLTARAKVPVLASQPKLATPCLVCKTEQTGLRRIGQHAATFPI
jgi:hypothetical protein